MLGPSMTLPETLKLPQACLIYKVVGLLLALPENLHFKSNKQVEEHRYIYPEVSAFSVSVQSSILRQEAHGQESQVRKASMESISPESFSSFR